MSFLSESRLCVCPLCLLCEVSVFGYLSVLVSSLNVGVRVSGLLPIFIVIVCCPFVFSCTSSVISVGSHLFLLSSVYVLSDSPLACIEFSLFVCFYMKRDHFGLFALDLLFLVFSKTSAIKQLLSLFPVS